MTNVVLPAFLNRAPSSISYDAVIANAFDAAAGTDECSGLLKEFDAAAKKYGAKEDLLESFWRQTFQKIFGGYRVQKIDFNFLEVCYTYFFHFVYLFDANFINNYNPITKDYDITNFKFKDPKQLENIPEWMQYRNRPGVFDTIKNNMQRFMELVVDAGNEKKLIDDLLEQRPDMRKCVQKHRNWLPVATPADERQQERRHLRDAPQTAPRNLPTSPILNEFRNPTVCNADTPLGGFVPCDQVQPFGMRLSMLLPVAGKVAINVPALGGQPVVPAIPSAQAPAAAGNFRFYLNPTNLTEAFAVSKDGEAFKLNKDGSLKKLQKPAR